MCRCDPRFPDPRFPAVFPQYCSLYLPERIRATYVFNRRPLPSICWQDYLPTERSFEFGQAPSETQPVQLPFLLPVDLHLIILVQNDESPVVSSVICRRQT